MAGQKSTSKVLKRLGWTNIALNAITIGVAIAFIVLSVFNPPLAIIFLLAVLGLQLASTPFSTRFLFKRISKLSKGFGEIYTGNNYEANLTKRIEASKRATQWIVGVIATLTFLGMAALFVLFSLNILLLPWAILGAATLLFLYKIIASAITKFTFIRDVIRIFRKNGLIFDENGRLRHPNDIKNKERDFTLEGQISILQQLVYACIDIMSELLFIAAVAIVFTVLIGAVAFAPLSIALIAGCIIIGSLLKIANSYLQLENPDEQKQAKLVRFVCDLGSKLGLNKITYKLLPTREENEKKDEDDDIYNVAPPITPGQIKKGKSKRPNNNNNDKLMDGMGSNSRQSRSDMLTENRLNTIDTPINRDDESETDEDSDIDDLFADPSATNKTNPQDTPSK